MTMLRALLFAALLCVGFAASAQQVTRGTPVAATNVGFGDTATASVNASGSDALVAFTPFNDNGGAGTINSDGVVFNGSETFTRLCINDTQQRAGAVFILLNPTQTTANVVATWTVAGAGAGLLHLVVIPVNNVDSVSTQYCNSAASGTSITSGNVTTSNADGLFLTAVTVRTIVSSLAVTGTGHSAIGTETDGDGIRWLIGEQDGSTSNQTPGYGWTTTSENAIAVVALNASSAAGGLLLRRRRN